jgi:hypothetical protein
MSDRAFRNTMRAIFTAALIFHTISSLGYSNGDYGFAFSVFIFGLACWYFGYVEGETKEQSK